MWILTLVFICIVQLQVSKQEEIQPSNQDVINYILKLQNSFDKKLPDLLEEKITSILEVKLSNLLIDKLPGLLEEKLPIILKDKLPDLLKEDLSTIMKDNLSDFLEDKMSGLLEDKVLDHIEENLSDMHYRMRKVDDTLVNVKDDLGFIRRNIYSMKDDIESLEDRLPQSQNLSSENGQLLEEKTLCEADYLKQNISKEFHSLKIRFISLEETILNKMNDTSAIKFNETSTLTHNDISALPVNATYALTSNYTKAFIEKRQTEDQCNEEEGLCILTGNHCNGTIKILFNSYEDRCTCCVPEKVPTEAQCTEKYYGLCIETNDRCNGTINFLYNSHKDYCTCCVHDMQVPTDEQCTEKEGLCIDTEDRCNGTIKFLHNSQKDHCTCCVPNMQVPTDQQCASEDGLCMKTGDQTDRCEGKIKTLYNSHADHCTCCISDKKVCILPWTSIGNSKGCFLFVETKKVWDDARTHCQTVGGDLAILDEQSKRIDMYNYLEGSDLTDDDLWLGANDRSGSWLWLNGKNIMDGWGDAQPNGDSGDDTCVYIYDDRDRDTYDILFDIGCSDRAQYYICEK